MSRPARWKPAGMLGALLLPVTAPMLLGSGGGAGEAVTHTVEIRGMAFHPEELTVHPGDTVVWINRDPVPHTATASDSAWTSPELAEDGRWEWVAGEAGSRDYLCAYHPLMTGRVTVEPTSREAAR